MNKTVGFSKKTVRDVPLDGQTVLVRADYNVPLNDKGEIDDDYRIRMSLPTIEALRERGCRVVVCSHLGRPDGVVTKKFSLAPVAERLSQLLKTEVQFVTASVGDKVRSQTRRLRAGDVLLLENLRFHAEEEANDMEFAHQLALSSRARYFVQDGFGVVHRAHASTSAITQWLPAIAGPLLERECVMLSGVIRNPQRPLVAVLGGAKISDKIGVVEKFARMADHVIIGGAMADTFLAYKGVSIGRSKSEEGLEATIQRIYEAAGDQPDKIVLPRDVAVGSSLEATAERREVTLDAIGDDDMILDIGSHSIEEVVKLVSQAATVVWNGTLGYAELRQFAHGSARLALELATHPDIVSVIGGGDTADFVLDWDSREGGSFHHVSTGGGASLELMAGNPMPGVDALLDA